ncbi:MAG: hypothetical protein U0946_07550 [Patescibacteria group bacterium]|nr:hypothetical protein [Patescibacteria group bacterium]
MSINTQRLTISLPDYVYDQLLMMFDRGRISKFISEATEKLLIAKRMEAKTDPVEEFLNLRKTLKFPKMTDKQIKKAINKGRA